MSYGYGVVDTARAIIECNMMRIEEAVFKNDMFELFKNGRPEKMAGITKTDFFSQVNDCVNVLLANE